MDKKCYECGAEGVIRCDWCNTFLCQEHFNTHTTKDCDRIENELRLKRMTPEEREGRWHFRDGSYYFVPKSETIPHAIARIQKGL